MFIVFGGLGGYGEMGFGSLAVFVRFGELSI